MVWCQKKFVQLFGDTDHIRLSCNLALNRLDNPPSNSRPACVSNFVYVDHIPCRTLCMVHINETGIESLSRSPPPSSVISKSDESLFILYRCPNL